MLEGPLTESVQQLRDETDGVVSVAGSRTLVHHLLVEGLVDELRLAVFPVILGSGFRVFPDTAHATGLTLQSHGALASGVQLVTYRRS